jgi:hypothetical protein
MRRLYLPIRSARRDPQTLYSVDLPEEIAAPLREAASAVGLSLEQYLDALTTNFATQETIDARQEWRDNKWWRDWMKRQGYR